MHAQIAKFKFCQYQNTAISPNLTPAKFSHYTVLADTNDIFKLWKFSTNNFIVYVTAQSSLQFSNRPGNYRLCSLIKLLAIFSIGKHLTLETLPCYVVGHISAYFRYAIVYDAWKHNTHICSSSKAEIETGEVVYFLPAMQFLHYPPVNML